jgi:hypothetical protein
MLISELDKAGFIITYHKIKTRYIIFARNLRILQFIIKDAVTVRFGILLLCQERNIVILNYNADCLV